MLVRANVFAVLQVCPVPVPGSQQDNDGDDEQSAAPGCCLFACFDKRSRARPVVHKGFALAYETGGARKRILELLNTLFDEGTVAKRRVRVYVTGHSQGAAVAALCAGAPLSVRERD